jgi:hypothetical protein
MAKKRKQTDGNLERQLEGKKGSQKKRRLVLKNIVSDNFKQSGRKVDENGDE